MNAGAFRRGRRGRLFATLSMALPLVVLHSCSSSPDEARYDAEYLLIDHLDSVVVVTQGRRPLSVPRFEIGFDQRRVLYQQASSEVRFPEVPSGPGARFLAAPVLNPKAWAKPTDGVVFEALCRTQEDAPETLLRLAVSPASDPDDRVWHDRRLPLDACSAPTTEITLRTSCGPRNNCAADWSAWGNPRVVREEALSLRPERLVLWISIDTLRADRLGLYGAERETSPELERMAGDAVVFDQAIAPAPWTIPSHASMLTSTDPRVHGANDRTPISESATSVVEILRRSGWQTAGFVDTPYLGAELGFDRGFEHFDDDPPPAGDSRRGAGVTRRRLLEWLLAADERPAFVFWHVMDVHGPYWAPAPFGGKFRDAIPSPGSPGGGQVEGSPDPDLEKLKQLGYHDYLRLGRYRSLEDLVAAYDEGIATVDSIIGGLLLNLRAAGLYDQALIVVTSDHGESLFDHGVWVGHGLFLTDDEIRVPLIMKLPGNRHAGTRVREMVGLIDVAPSVVDVLGLAPVASFEGRSLFSPAVASPESLPAAVYGVSSNIGAAFVRTNSFKYIGPASDSRGLVSSRHLKIKNDVSLPLDALLSEQLYDLRRDPLETAPLTDTGDSEGLERFRTLLDQHTAECTARRAGTPTAAPAELSNEAIERLRALGYVDW